MARHIHIHLHKQQPTQDAEPEGKWVTIHGTHVFIGKGGKIEKGPAALVGKTEAEAHSGGKKEHPKIESKPTPNEHSEFGHSAQREAAYKKGKGKTTYATTQMAALSFPDKSEEIKAALKEHGAATVQISGKEYHLEQFGGHVVGTEVSKGTAKVPATKEQLYAEWNGKRVPVSSMEEAQKKWDEFRDRSGAGVSQIGNGMKITDATGKHVGHVSYNGRAWNAKGEAMDKDHADWVKNPTGPAGLRHMARELRSHAQMLESRKPPGWAQEAKAKLDAAAAHEAEAAKKEAESKAQPKKLTKVEAKKQAKAERERAGRSDGSYAKAADLYEQAGDTENAKSMRSLAKMYGHDDKGVSVKKQADMDAASTARAQAKRAASSKAHALLLEKAKLHEDRANGNVEDAKISARLSSLNDELAQVESKLGDGDLDKMRAVHRDAAETERLVSKHERNDNVKALREHKAKLHEQVAEDPGAHPPGHEVYGKVRALGEEIAYARALRSPVGGVALHPSVQAEDNRRAATKKPKK